MKRAFLPIFLLCGLGTCLLPTTASAQTCSYSAAWSATAIYTAGRYIKANGLGGGYVWAVKDDDANGTLVKALASGLHP